MKLAFGMAALLLSQAGAVPVFAQAQQAAAAPSGVDAERRKEAMLPIENYIRSQETGKADYARAAFHKDAIMTGVNRAGYVSTPIDDKWFAGYTGKPSDDEPQAKRTVEFIDLTPTTGFVRLKSVYPNMAFEDYMMLLKVDGKWQIMQKLFHRLRAPTAESQNAAKAAGPAEIKAALVPIENYIKALETENVEFAKRAFHPDARMIGVNARGYYFNPISEFIKNMDGTPDADEAQRVRSIEMIDLTPTSGVVRLELTYPSIVFIDHMSLAKIDGEWKIVQKLFHAARPLTFAAPPAAPSSPAPDASPAK
jgi:hypothetical protein